MYVMFPMLCALGVKLRVRWLPALATVALCGWSLYWNRAGVAHPTVVIYGTSLASALDAAPYFLLGASYQFYGLRRFLSPVVALGLLGIGIFLQPSTALAMELGQYLLAPYAILSFALVPAPVFSRAGRWGDFSYGLYLYGFPLQQTVNFLWPRPMTALQNAAIAGLAALLFAVLSWHLVEKRMLAMKPGRRRTTPAVAQVARHERMLPDHRRRWVHRCAVSSSLSDRFENVVVVDNLHPQVHARRVRPEALDPRAKLVQSDICDSRTWDEVLDRWTRPSFFTWPPRPGPASRSPRRPDTPRSTSSAWPGSWMRWRSVAHFPAMSC